MINYIYVRVGDFEFPTYIDDQGTQRFITNSVIDFLTRRCQNKISHGIDLNQLCLDYHAGKFTKEDLLLFYVQLGYSVCGLEELDYFNDMGIDNPLWEERIMDKLLEYYSNQPIIKKSSKQLYIMKHLNNG